MKAPSPGFKKITIGNRFLAWPQLVCFLVGTILIISGLSESSQAASGGNISFNDQRVAEVVNGLLTYLEGSFGAIIMVICGLCTICAAAFGQYRVAIGLLVVAIGSFTLRSFMSTFFNDVNIIDGGGSGPGVGVPAPAGSFFAIRHNIAIDVYTPQGISVLAYEDGQVRSVGSKDKCGNFVSIEHVNGLTSRYCHLQSVEVGKQQAVNKGQIIGKVGSSGLASNARPHLHFEIRRDGQNQNTPGYLGVEVEPQGRVRDPSKLNGWIVDLDKKAVKAVKVAPPPAGRTNPQAERAPAAPPIGEDYESF